ncbi:corrinoid protein [Desulfosudis oleivorans]|uniref:Cobalamin B12-binding domain protein n=1 Tax=Desulfosudis oleivorans (strain DSM 6200 / JCM 39069 / Hxd3) TaxID=96561 RepID=A8ZX61_DESOH|nr:corrinoid protein [Desulfosudis oleivorans]ABW66917.1 cobalamin B12-binding domain protein [Desulfosudis oleivorans Hxd3]
MTQFANMTEAILAGDPDRVKQLAEEGISRGDDAGAVMAAMIGAMDIVGEKMEAEDMFIPEVLMSAKAMSAGTELLKPHLAEGGDGNKGTLVIGSVHGDLHDIGKNLVKMLMEGSGFSVVDLGTNVAPDAFLAAVKEHSASLVGMSALLTTTMPVMKEVVDALKNAGLRDQVKVLVGGAPVTDAYAEQIGADAYGADAGSAVRIAKSLV